MQVKLKVASYMSRCKIEMESIKKEYMAFRDHMKDREVLHNRLQQEEVHELRERILQIVSEKEQKEEVYDEMEDTIKSLEEQIPGLIAQRD